MEHSYDLSNKDSCCHTSDEKPGVDYLFLGSFATALVLALLNLFGESYITKINWLNVLSSSVVELIKTIWWGILFGTLSVGVLSRIPREFVISVLGNGGRLNGIVRATLGGVFLDLCSHGILMVGAKLYERGASIGQIMSFLIASPWNSFSLTLVLMALVGVKWTMLFIVLSMMVAILTGYIFDTLVDRKKIPANPNKTDIPEGFNFTTEAKKSISQTSFNLRLFSEIIRTGVSESRMIVRWVLFGVILTSLIRAFVPADIFHSLFGPSVAGLAFTLLAATIIEVCSEGSTPIAADLLTRASAPGNSFAFLMAGMATDYTELAVIKQTTNSWIITLLLPIIAIPQIFIIGLLLNV